MGRISGSDKENTRKCVWSKREDQLLIKYVQNHGQGNWPSVSKAAGLRRCRKSCRFRWMNYLRPDLKKGDFSQEETNLIISLHRVLGNKWSQIAARIPGRTDNAIKNYWNCHLKRQLLARGIDPVTHQSLNRAAAGPATSADPPTNSKVSGVTTAGKKNTSNNASISTKQIYDFNVYLNTEVQVSSAKYSGGDGAGSSSSASGVTVTTTEEVHHPHLNLELSLAPPSQPEDENNSMVPEQLKPQKQVLLLGNDVNVSLGL